MHWLSRLSSPGHVGIAVGKHWINLARVVRRGTGYEVAATGSLPAAERGALRRVVEEIRGRGLPATVSLVDGELHQETLDLPPLSARDLRRVVARESKAGADALLAWSVGPAAPDGTREVAARALGRERVRALGQEVEKAGLLLTDIVPHSIAVVTAMTRPSDPADALLSLIEVWDHNADLILARGGRRLYDRHINRGLGGRRGEGAVPAMDEPDFGEVSLDFFDEPPDTAPGAAPAVPPAWERLAEEVHRTHLYAKKNLKAGEVARAVLTGPCAEDTAFVTWLSGKLGAEVVPLASYRDDLVWRRGFDPRMVLPVGAALAGLADTPADNRMVPAEMRRREAAAPLSYSATALLVCTLLLGGMGVLYQARAVSRQAAEVEGLRQALHRLEQAPAPEPARLRGPGGTPLALPPDLAAAFPGARLLATLGAAMPAEARLRTATARWEGGAWRLALEGEVLAPPVAALRAIGDLVAALEASGRFGAIRLDPVSARLDVTPFALTVQVGGTGAGPA